MLFRQMLVKDKLEIFLAKRKLDIQLNAILLISFIRLSEADLMDIGGLFTYWKPATRPGKRLLRQI